MANHIKKRRRKFRPIISPGSVYLPHPHLVQTRFFQNQLGRALRNLNLSRREIADLFDYVLMTEGLHFINCAGAELKLDEFYDDFMGQDRDYTWISRLIDFAETYPVRKPHSRSVFRLQICWVIFELIGKPVIKHRGS